MCVCVQVGMRTFYGVSKKFSTGFPQLLQQKKTESRLEMQTKSEHKTKIKIFSEREKERV